MSNNSTESEDIGNMIKRRLLLAPTIASAQASINAISASNMNPKRKQEAIDNIINEVYGIACESWHDTQGDIKPI